MGLTVAELDAKLTMDDSGFSRGMGQAEQGIDRLRQRGEGLKNVGDRMTKSVTLPIVGVGIAAGKVAMDFDGAMSRITGLVGVASDEVDVMRDGVLDLAGETTKSPQELADALFTVTSAGFRGSEAMDVLELSAKASAAGLGETRDIAEAVTATINTYGSDVIDAAQATDILVATAQAGNFATEDLAGGLGRVLPNAKAANVSFEDLGGTIALLTRQNNDANQSITQSDALFRAFVRPSGQAKEVLEGLGLSADKVRESLGEQGLVPTLQMLEQKLIEQTGSSALAREELAKIIEDSSGFSAALMILDSDLETIDGTFGTTAEATGMLSDAWAAFAGSDSFEAQRALAELQVALIKLGEIILPVAGKIFGFAADVMQAFSQLPEPVLMTVVAFAGLVAAVGPVLGIAGRVIILFTTLRRTLVAVRGQLTAMGLSAGATAGILGGVGLAITAVTLLWQDHAAKQAAAKARQEELTAALEETNGALEGQAADVVTNTLVSDDLKDSLLQLGIFNSDLIKGLREGGSAWTDITDRIQAARDAGAISKGEFFGLQMQLGRLADETSAANEAFRNNQAFTEGAGTAAAEAAGALGELDAQSQRAADSIAAVVSDDVKAGFNELGITQADLISALVEGGDAWDQLRGQVDAAREAGEISRGEWMGIQLAMEGMRNQTDEAGASFKANTAIVEESAEATEEAAGGFEDLEGDARMASDALDEATSALDAYLDEVREAIDDTFSLDQAERGYREALAASKEALDESNGELGAHNEAARDAESSVEDLVGSTWDLIEAAVREADTEADAEDAVKSHRSELRSQLRQMGLNESQVDKYVGALDGADGAWIAQLRADTADAEAKVAAYKNALAAVPSVVSTTMSLGASVFSSAMSNFHTGGVVPAPSGQEFAAVLLGQEEVLTEDDPRHSANIGMMSSSGGGGGGTTVIELSAKDRLGAALMDALTAEVKRRGGGGPDSVQVAFGSR